MLVKNEAFGHRDLGLINKATNDEEQTDRRRRGRAIARHRGITDVTGRDNPLQ